MAFFCEDCFLLCVRESCCLYWLAMPLLQLECWNETLCGGYTTGDSSMDRRSGQVGVRGLHVPSTYYIHLLPRCEVSMEIIPPSKSSNIIFLSHLDSSFSDTLGAAVTKQLPVWVNGLRGRNIIGPLRVSSALR